MSKLKLQATDGNGGTVSLKGPASTTGNAEFELTLPGSAGSNGQVLASNGSGVLTWSNAANVGGATGVDFNDNVKARWGTGNDLEIYHDGDSSYINHVTSGTDFVIDAKSPGDDLILRAADDVNIRVQGNETAINCIGDGAVELYYDNAKKLETTAQGVDIGFSDGLVRFMAANGSANISVDIQNWALKMWDNSKILMGAGSDLQIYHDGSNSYIKDTGTGDLNIAGSIVRLQSSGGETLCRGVENGAFELYYDNKLNLATTGGGIKVSSPDGEATIQIEGYENNAATLQFNADEGDDHADFWRLRNGTGTDFSIENYADSAWEKSIECNESGNVELYYDNTLRFHTTSAGAEVEGRLFVGNASDTSGNGNAIWVGDDNDLKIYHDGWDRITSADLYINNQANNAQMIHATQGGYVGLFHDGSKKFETTSGGVIITSADGADTKVKGDFIFAKAGETTTRVMWDGSSGSAGKLEFSDDVVAEFGDGGDLQIFHSGGYSKVEDSSSAGLILRNTSGADVFIQSDDDVIIGNYTTSSEYYIRAIEGGAVELYHDASKKFETKSYGVKIEGDLWLDDNKVIKVGSSGDLQIYHSGSHSHINHVGTGDLFIDSVGHTVLRNSAGTENRARFVDNGLCEFYYDGRLCLYTTTNGARVENADSADCELRIFGGQTNRAAQLTLTADNGAAHDDNFRIEVNHNYHFGFWAKPGGTWAERFRMEQNGSLTATDTTISALSDNRLKKNTADFTYDLAKFKQFKPKTYEWINTATEHQSGVHRGFLAQDIESVDSHLVSDYLLNDASPDKDLVDSDKIAKSAKLGTNDAMYISVIQQLISKIETLETKVAALGG